MKMFIEKNASDLQAGEWLCEQGGAVFEITAVQLIAGYINTTIDARGWISLGADYKKLKFNPKEKVCVMPKLH